MFMVSVHASFCALSKIDIVVSVHARHLAQFSEILYGMGYAFNPVHIILVGSGPGHLGHHSTYVSLAILLTDWGPP